MVRENTARVCVSVTRAGKGRSVTSPPISARTRPVTTEGSASMASVSVRKASPARTVESVSPCFRPRLYESL